MSPGYLSPFLHSQEGRQILAAGQLNVRQHESTTPMREYTLYVRNKRSYEVVPVGLSWGALLLGILWAMGNGLTIRYLAVVAITAAPFIFFLIVDESLYGFIAIVGLAAINAGHIYFSLKAFEWREAILNAQGFRPVASIAARSAKEALRTWANSDDALDYV